MTLICRIATSGFALAYAGALLVLLTGTFGWFGAERDPLAGVFVLPLGLPWALAVGGASEPLRPWLAALTPLVNLAILAGLCRWARTILAALRTRDRDRPGRH